GNHHQQLDQREATPWSVVRCPLSVAVSDDHGSLSLCYPSFAVHRLCHGQRTTDNGQNHLLSPSSSLISGRNRAMTIKPITRPRNTIINGSRRLIRLSTITSTSSSYTSATL